jgi:hypothetical protein
MPPTHYRIYESSTTDARIDQPSGPSKMCLSCHDGALALGLLASRPPNDPGGDDPPHHSARAPAI